MEYVLENAALKLTVSSHGAEPVSVVYKATGRECLWQGDKAVWGRHAPILFPYAGKLPEGKLVVDGKEYPGGQHGFARDLEHTLAEQSPDKLVLELASSPETLERFPFPFLLRSTFTLEGNTVHHTLTVENPGSGPLQFGLGYHPAFVCPFDGDHDTQDYEFRFDKLESPLVLKTSAKGLLSGECGYFGTNLDAIPLTDRLFDHDSFCFGNLKSTTLGIYEKGSDRSVVCNIAPFPYTLIWSALSEKIHFVCIEPWHSLPGVEGGSSNWTDQAAAARLAPGESFTTTLSTTFNG